MSELLPACLLLAPSPARRRLLVGAGLAHGVLAAGWSAALLLTAPAPPSLLAWLPGATCAVAAAVILHGLRRHARTAVTLYIEGASHDEAAAPGRPENVLDKLRRATARRTFRARGAQGRPAARLAGESAAVVRLCDPHASFVGLTRIVLQDRHRRVVVWRDATDRDTFRRLAAWARWRMGTG